MTLINTDGMALIGPGSEWLWTAVSGIVLAVTFLAIYRQLRLQRNAAALDTIASLRREWYSEGMARARRQVLVSLRDGVDRAKLGREPTDLANFWETIGYLARTRHIDRRLVYEVFGNVVVQWWDWLGPSAQVWRERQGSSTVWENFEWLARHITEVARREGGARGDDAQRARLLLIYIEEEKRAICAAEELRAVIVRRMPPAPAMGSR